MLCYFSSRGKSKSVFFHWNWIYSRIYCLTLKQTEKLFFPIFIVATNCSIVLLKIVLKEQQGRFNIILSLDDLTFTFTKWMEKLSETILPNYTRKSFHLSCFKAFLLLVLSPYLHKNSCFLYQPEWEYFCSPWPKRIKFRHHLHVNNIKLIFHGSTSLCHT